MQYLIQYGKYKTSKLVEDESEEKAIKQVFESGLTWGDDINHDVLVIELPKGKLFKVDRNLTVTSK